MQINAWLSFSDNLRDWNKGFALGYPTIIDSNIFDGAITEPQITEGIISHNAELENKHGYNLQQR